MHLGPQHLVKEQDDASETNENTSSPQADKACQQDVESPPIAAPLPFELKLGDDCIFCLKEFQAGDVVVFSPTQQQKRMAGLERGGGDNTQNRNPDEPSCPHMFHLDCMIEWLSIGKEQCPICRGPFVPKDCVPKSRPTSSRTRGENPRRVAPQPAATAASASASQSNAAAHASDEHPVSNLNDENDVENPTAR